MPRQLSLLAVVILLILSASSVSYADSATLKIAEQSDLIASANSQDLTLRNLKTAKGSQLTAEKSPSAVLSSGRFVSSITSTSSSSETTPSAQPEPIR